MLYKNLHTRFCHALAHQTEYMARFQLTYKRAREFSVAHFYRSRGPLNAETEKSLAANLFSSGAALMGVYMHSVVGTLLSISSHYIPRTLKLMEK
jgi:hypothetical protein